MRRLLLVEPGGRVVLCDLDNGERVEMDGVAGGSPSGGSSPARTAAWSAAGQWVGYALDAVELDGAHEVRVRHLESDTDRMVESELTAFYMSPSPDGRYLGHLSPGPLGLEFGLSDLETGDLRIIERGQPLFWSWSPDSTMLAVHVEDTVNVVSLDGGDPQLLSDDAGSFLAPGWAADGSVVMIAGESLVRYQPDGSDSETVARDIAGRCVVDPDGRRVAFVDMVDDNPAVVVVDLVSGQRTVLLNEQPGGFFWSPDGQRLAVVVMAGPNQVQWVVADGDEVVRLAPFRPATGWVREVLPFFEQYAQSHAVWSADGLHLVAPGLDGDGTGEAVVQTIDDPSRTQRVPGARLAWWANR